VFSGGADLALLATMAPKLVCQRGRQQIHGAWPRSREIEAGAGRLAGVCLLLPAGLRVAGSRGDSSVAIDVARQRM
jgi:hypothetical protein